MITHDLNVLSISRLISVLINQLHYQLNSSSIEVTQLYQILQYIGLPSSHFLQLSGIQYAAILIFHSFNHSPTSLISTINFYQYSKYPIKNLSSSSHPHTFLSSCYLLSSPLFSLGLWSVIMVDIGPIFTSPSPKIPEWSAGDYILGHWGRMESLARGGN